MGQPVVHFEIGCRDIGKTADFFSRLFGWQMQAMGPSTMINTGAGSGRQGHISSLGHEPHNYTTFYVQVDDVQGYLDKAAGLGGKPSCLRWKSLLAPSPGWLTRKETPSDCGNPNELSRPDR